MLSNMSRLLVPIMLVALLAVTACGGSDESAGWDLFRSADEPSVGHPGAPGAPAAPAAPAAAAAPAPVVEETMAAPAAAPAATAPRLVRVSEQAAAGRYRGFVGDTRSAGESGTNHRPHCRGYDRGYGRAGLHGPDHGAGQRNWAVGSYPPIDSRSTEGSSPSVFRLKPWIRRPRV